MTVTQSRTFGLPDGLRYYLLRGNAMVPLLPADQLPFQLQGIPRQLSHRQMSDENWKLLHETELIAMPLSIHVPSLLHLKPTVRRPTNSLSPQLLSISKAQFLAPDHHVRTESASVINETPQPSRWTLSHHPNEEVPVHQQASQASGVERYESLTDRLASVYPKDAQRFGYTKPYPSGIEPDPSKKEFCTHWIKTGECAFTSIGCKFKHEMPAMDKLRDVGFIQVPKWWKEKSAITARGPTWMERRLALGKYDNNQLGEIPASRAFPDPSTFEGRQTDEPGIPLESLQPSSRTNPPSTPMPDVVARRESKIPNLLIDLEETPAPPPSPQLSDRLVSSAEFCNTLVPSSRGSASPPPTFVTLEAVSTNTECAKLPDVAEAKHDKKEALKNCLTSRESLFPWTCENEDSVPQVRPLSEHQILHRKAVKCFNKPVKQPGLLNSKHAAANSNLTLPAQLNIKNAPRRVFQPESSGGAAAESRTKVGVVQRGRIARPKGCGKKGEPVDTLGTTKHMPT
jgi:hypothetical protein